MFTKFVRRYRHFYSIINSSKVFLNRLYKYQRPLNEAEMSKTLQLLIRFEKGEWMITLTDVENEVIAFEWLETGEYLDEQTMLIYLKKFLQEYNYDGGNANLVICGEQFHTFPAGFSSDNEDWAGIINNVDNSTGRLITEPLDNNYLELLYSIPEALIRVLEAIPVTFEITHQASIFYKEQVNASYQDAVCICLYRNDALVQAIVNGTTFFLKRISWKTQDDLLFEVMSLFKHFSMDPNEIPLYAGGMITQGSPVFHILQRYIRDVFVVEFSSFQLLSHLPDLHENHLIEKV